MTKNGWGAYLMLAFLLPGLGCGKYEPDSVPSAPKRNAAKSDPVKEAAMLETDCFKISFPRGWQLVSTAPAVIKGVGGATVQLSSATVKGYDSNEQLSAGRDQIEQNAIAAMTAAANDPRLETRKGLVRRVVNADTVIHEMQSVTKEQAILFAQFAVVGPRTVVLATYEGPATGPEEVDAVRSSLDTIKWTDHASSLK